MTTTPTASTRTVDRALDLLAAVTEQPRLSLTEAARATELPASTALRLLRSLEGSGFVARDDDGAYRWSLTIGLCPIPRRDVSKADTSGPIRTPLFRPGSAPARRRPATQTEPNPS